MQGQNKWDLDIAKSPLTVNTADIFTSEIAKLNYVERGSNCDILEYAHYISVFCIKMKVTQWCLDTKKGKITVIKADVT